MTYDPIAHRVFTRVNDRLQPDGTLRTPLYVEVTKGRFEGSVGRIERAEKIKVKKPYAEDQIFVYVVFEPGGRAYKFEASDYNYYSKITSRHDIKSDDSLRLVDGSKVTTIPVLKDRYGTEITVGMMMVVHTAYGLKVGTVKSITPKGTVRFRDFDESNTEFTKGLSSGMNCAEIMALQKDFMDQMLLRKLARG